jgi:hypothetical protein
MVVGKETIAVGSMASRAVRSDTKRSASVRRWQLTQKGNLLLAAMGLQTLGNGCASVCEGFNTQTKKLHIADRDMRQDDVQPKEKTAATPDAHRMEQWCDWMEGVD